MDIDYINEIALKYMNIYDFKKSDKFSRDRTTVFIAPDQAHWLSIEPIDENHIQARLSNENGIVTQRDNYYVYKDVIFLEESINTPQKAVKKSD